MNVYLGVDTGGTFTDFVLFRSQQLITHKVLSTPHAPEQAIAQGVQDLALDKLTNNEVLYIVHGSTVATNAVLEGKGVKTVLITNRGLKDILTLGRQTRRELYNLQPEIVKPPVESEYCIETGGRLSAQGEVIEPLTDHDIDAVIRELEVLAPQAVAINLLFSYLDDRFEKQLQAALPDTVFVCRSSEILPLYKEYERGMTTWLNAYIGPLVAGYIQRLQQAIPHAHIAVMQSSGTTMTAQQAGKQAVHMLLSGPAGGLAAARHLGEQLKQHRLLTFDMGGTSTDVALIDGEIQLTTESYIADYPVAIPMVDMHTIGAGGGSIAFIDAGGLLQVGPQSAGANPGPACYGQGGRQPTVTDANLLLGRLLEDVFLGGSMSLHKQAAMDAVIPLAEQLGLTTEQTAYGIVRIANERMAHALRVMSVQRGIDPRLLTLVSFGGAGGLHVCALADALSMLHAIVPMNAGVLSASGMLVAPRGRQLSITLNGMLSGQHAALIHEQLQQLKQRGYAELAKEGVDRELIETTDSLDLRYQGQSYTLNVPWTDVVTSKALFHQRHETRYGHKLALPIELVNIRTGLKAKQDAPKPNVSMPERVMPAYRTMTLAGIMQQVPVYHRAQLVAGQSIHGPALITETVSTTYIAPGWSCQVDKSGNLLLEKSVNATLSDTGLQ